MGWWSTTILGGDDAMDAENEVLRVAGLVRTDGSDIMIAPHDDPGADDYYVWEDHPDRTKRALEAVPVARWKALFATHKDKDYRRVLQQVTALIHMQVGAALPDALAQAALHACQTEQLGWREPKARQARLEEFMRAIDRYDGTPVILAQESLGEAMAALHR